MQCKKCETGRQYLGLEATLKPHLKFYECSLCGGLGFSSGLRDFIDAYLECALWSSTNEDGENLDSEYYPEDIDPKTLEAMQTDCKGFYDANNHLWADADGYSDEQAGHDFWLTRNGHGAGFWDRGQIQETGKELTQHAKIYGGFDLYVGDDGIIYGS